MEDGLSPEISVPTTEASSSSPRAEQPIPPQTKQPAIEQSEQPPVNQAEPVHAEQSPTDQSDQPTTQPSNEEPSQPKDESAELQNSQQRYIDQLPQYLKDRFSVELTDLMKVIVKQKTQGLKEVATLVLLERVAGEGTLPPDPEDPEKKYLTIKLQTNPPEIEINGSTKKIVEIIKVEGDSFVCQLADQEGTVNIPVSQVIEAQKAIVDKAEGTGIVKASALKKFLETAREQLKAPSEGQGEQSLSEDKKQQLDRINNLIASLEGQLTPDQATFAEALSLVLPLKQSEIQGEVIRLKELIDSEDLSPNEKQKLQTELDGLLTTLSPEKITELAKTLFEKIDQGNLTTQQIDQINKLLQGGEFDLNSFEIFLNQQEKSNSSKAIEWVRKNAPIIGGVFGLLLLLMIFKAAKSGGGQGQMMG